MLQAAWSKLSHSHNLIVLHPDDSLTVIQNPSPSCPDDSSAVIQKKFYFKNHNELVSAK